MQVEVTQKDPQLLNRIFQNELDAFVYKGVTAYLYACGLFCKDDLANTNPYKQDGSYILPKTLRDFNYTIRTSMNPLWKLVESDLATCEEPMTRHKNMCITLTAFTAQYHKYCRTNFKNMHTEDLNSDVYIPVFRKFGIEARVAKRKWEGAWVETTFIDGIGMTRMCVAALRDPSDVRGPLLPLQPPPPPPCVCSSLPALASREASALAGTRLSSGVLRASPPTSTTKRPARTGCPSSRTTTTTTATTAAPRRPGTWVRSSARSTTRVTAALVMGPAAAAVLGPTTLPQPPAIQTTFGTRFFEVCATGRLACPT